MRTATFAVGIFVCDLDQSLRRSSLSSGIAGEELPFPLVGDLGPRLEIDDRLSPA